MMNNENLNCGPSKDFDQSFVEVDTKVDTKEGILLEIIQEECKNMDNVFAGLSDNESSIQLDSKIGIKEEPITPRVSPSVSPTANVPKRNISPEEERQHQCNQCEKRFLYKSYLMRHQRMHAGERPFQCEQCDKKFTYKCHLVRHVENHTGERPHQCEICGKSFIHKCSLVMHAKIHTGEREYQCHICGKSFAYKCAWVRHNRIHTLEKSHQCEVCGRNFARNDNLLKHKRNVHPQERP